MTYEALSEKLTEYFFYPALVTRVKNKSKVVEGLQIDCPPILKMGRQQRLEELVGDEFTVKWQGNGEINQHFLIQHK